MRSAIPFPIIVFATILAGCGSKEADTADTGAAPAASAKAAADSRVAATAEENAKAARGKFKCPPKTSMPPRADGAAVDDVVGVRPGMSYEDAANTVLCTNDMLIVQGSGRGFKINTYGRTLRQGFTADFAEPTINKTSKEILQEMQERTISSGGNRVVQDMKPGESKWYVGTMGMPGEERVISAAREEWFLEGRQPTTASVADALRAKYGTPSSDRDQAPQHVISWVHDPLGRPVPESSPLAMRCGGGFDPDGGINLSPDCGLVVTANIMKLRANPDLAEYLQVGVVDQTNGYEALQATQQGFEADEAARRAREVEEAQKNASGPQL